MPPNAAPAAAVTAPRGWGVALGIALTVLFLASTLDFSGFLADDAFISLRYARRLLDGHGLTWNDGEAVEGYSNLLWVLWCAAFGALGLDLVVVARESGWLCMTGALLAVAFLGGPRHRLASAVAGVALATTGALAAWARAGLEPPLLALLLALAAAAVSETLAPTTPGWGRLRPAAAATVLGLLCLVRPDGAVLAGAMLLASLALAGGRRRVALLLGLGPVLAVLGQLLFRRLMYDDWVPNTAYAKVAFSWARVRTGLDYVLLGGLRTQAVLLLGPALALGLWRRATAPRRAAIATALMALAAWLIYLVAVGGDVFEGWRMHVPTAVLAGLLWREAVALALPATTSSRRQVQAALGALVVLGIPHLWLQRTDVRLRDARRSPLGAESLEVGAGLKAAFGSARPLLAVDAAGGVPYVTGFPAIDMLGLTDRYLAHHPPPGFGDGLIGHELGDGRYVRSRNPDLLIFSGPGGVEKPWFRSAVELAGLPGFARDYAFVVIGMPGPRHLAARLYVRRDAASIGLRREGQAVVIPPHFLANTLATPAQLVADGLLVVRLRSGQAVQALVPALEPGRWRARAEVTERPANGHLEVRAAGPGVVDHGGAEFSVSDGAAADVTVHVAAQGGSVEVGSLRLERLPVDP